MINTGQLFFHRYYCATALLVARLRRYSEGRRGRKRREMREELARLVGYGSTQLLSVAQNPGEKHLAKAAAERPVLLMRT